MRYALIFAFALTFIGAWAAELESFPEQDVLARYIGSWTIEFDEDDAFSNGVTEVSWSLNKAYVEHDSAFEARFVASDLQVKQLTTFDSGEKRFKRWSFASNRRSFQSTGTWDAASNTMTWTSEKMDTRRRRIVTTTTERFLEDGTIHSIALIKHGDHVSRTEAIYSPARSERKP